MTLNNIEALFKDLGLRHLQINSYYNQKAFDITAINEVVYPSLVINTSEIKLPRTDNGYSVKNFSIELQVIDLVHKDEGNKQEVLSDTESILNDIVNEFSTHPEYNGIGLDLIGDIILTPLRGAYGDEISGWNTVLTLEVPLKISWCGSPMLALAGFESNVDSVTVIDALNVDSPLTLYSGEYTCQGVAPTNITVSNSDDSYIVSQSVNLELPDITHTDSDGSFVTLPAQTPFVSTVCYVEPTIENLEPRSWYDAADVANTGNGTPVTQINDKSGNNNHLDVLSGTQIFRETGGQNNHPYMDCTNMYDYGSDSIPDRSMMTVYVVAKTTNQRHQLFGANGSAPYNQIMFGNDYTVNDRAIIFMGDGTSQSVNYSKTGTTGWIGDYQIKCMKVAYSSLQLSVNGALLSESVLAAKQLDANTPMQYAIGGGYRAFSGEFAECVVFDRNTTPEEDDVIVKELGLKYNIPVTLYSDGVDKAVSFAWGDSQTSGRALMANLTPKYQGIQNGSYIFLNNDTSIDNIHSNINNNQEQKSMKFAYEMSLGWEYKNRTGEDHILIKQAVGNGALDKTNFVNVNYSADYGTGETTGFYHKYHRFIWQYMNFLYYAQQGNINPKFKCVADFQGGADATLAFSSSRYRTNKEFWIDSFRNHTGLKLPMYQVLIPSGLNPIAFPFQSVIRTAQDDIKSLRSYVKSVDADSFPLFTDGHMKAEGEEYIGKTIADLI
jgi:hypothetical protein